MCHCCVWTTCHQWALALYILHVSAVWTREHSLLNNCSDIQSGASFLVVAQAGWKYKGKKKTRWTWKCLITKLWTHIINSTNFNMSRTGQTPNIPQNFSLTITQMYTFKIYQVDIRILLSAWHCHWQCHLSEVQCIRESPYTLHIAHE